MLHIHPNSALVQSIWAYVVRNIRWMVIPSRNAKDSLDVSSLLDQTDSLSDPQMLSFPFIEQGKPSFPRHTPRDHSVVV